MNMYILIGIMSGIVGAVEICPNEQTAQKRFDALCDEYGFRPEEDLGPQDNFVGVYCRAPRKGGEKSCEVISTEEIHLKRSSKK